MNQSITQSMYQEPLLLPSSFFTHAQDLKTKAIKDLLDSCLATDEELKNIDKIDDPLMLSELAAEPGPESGAEPGA